MYTSRLPSKTKPTKSNHIRTPHHCDWTPTEVVVSRHDGGGARQRKGLRRQRCGQMHMILIDNSNSPIRFSWWRRWKDPVGLSQKGGHVPCTPLLSVPDSRTARAWEGARKEDMSTRFPLHDALQASASVACKGQDPWAEGEVDLESRVYRTGP